MMRSESCSFLYRFTGKERDAESGLDYFGARYFGSSMGRFMSPDWSAKAEPVPYAKLADPQTLNLYAYVGNNPLSRTDPAGHEVDLGNSDAKLRDQTEKRILGNLKADERGFFGTSTKDGKTSLTFTAGDYSGKHSKAFGDLVKDIGSHNVVTVSIASTYQNSAGQTESVRTDYGGGVTHPDGHGNFSVYLSPDGHDGPVNGLQGQPKVPDPVDIIAGHELFGHVRLGSANAAGEPEAVGVENILRSQHQPSLGQRGCAVYLSGGCIY